MYEEGNKKGDREVQLLDIHYSAMLLQILKGRGRLPQLRNWGGNKPPLISPEALFLTNNEINTQQKR